jgi:hypothetical protein
VGDRVTVRVEVVERVVERNRLRLATVCTNQDGDLLLEGEAWVLPSTTRLEYAAARPAHRPVPVPLLPAALAVEVMSIWMTSGLALVSQALRLGPLAPIHPGLAGGPAAPEPDPLRP